MTTDRNRDRLEPEFVRFLTNPQTYSHVAWYIGNPSLSIHEATEISAPVAWTATSDFDTAGIETAS